MRAGRRRRGVIGLVRIGERLDVEVALVGELLARKIGLRAIREIADAHRDDDDRGSTGAERPGPPLAGRPVGSFTALSGHPPFPSRMAEACGSRTHLQLVYSRTPDLKSGGPAGFLAASVFTCPLLADPAEGGGQLDGPQIGPCGPEKRGALDRW